MNIDALMDELVRDEGLKLKVYIDTKGIETIGVGRNLREGISNEEAMMLLRNDVINVMNEAVRFPWFEDLSERRQRVILNMLFNMGLPRFKGFKKTIECIKNKDFLNASHEMLDSRWAMQTGMRAQRLAKEMREG